MQNSFSRTFLFMLAGPLIWAAHFVFVYSMHGVACARPAWQASWMSLPVSAWIIMAASLLALLAMAFAHFRLRHSGDDRFLSRLAAALCLLSAVAIIWETLPLLWVPAC